MSETTPSPQKIFLWNILGSLSTAAISVLLLLVVSRTLTDLEADIFSIAYAIGNLFVVIGLFQVRNFQSTDMQPKYTFNEYFVARLLSCLGMLVAAGIYIWIKGYEGYKAVIILMICLYRLTDALSDVFQGLFQQKQRLDIASKSLVYRNTIIFIIFTVSLIVSTNLVLALTMVCIVSSLFVLVYDSKYAKNFANICIKHISINRLISLFTDNLPLFLNGFLLVYIYNNPKYSLDKLLELGSTEVGLQKDFNILFMPAFVMNLMMLFLRPIITKMAISYHHKEVKEFSMLQKQMFLTLSLASVVILISSFYLGIPVLSLLYNTDLTSYHTVFMILMFGGVLSSFATIFDNILTVIRAQKFLVISYVAAFGISILTSDYFVLSYQILGASLSFLLAMCVWLVMSAIIYRFIKNKKIE
nr:lipopolysaccharide biosynthesis protein [Streptococcus respiraculi]